MSTVLRYPPSLLVQALPEHNKDDPDIIEDTTRLITEIKDYQVTHGSLLKQVLYEQPNTVPSIPVGTAAFPTPFPRRAYAQAALLQQWFNALYAAVAEDDAWLQEALDNMIRTDELTSVLWQIHSDTKNRSRGHQTIKMGIFRSDYMLQDRSPHAQTLGPSEALTTLRQVEFNTFSVAGGTHGDIVTKMHHHLHNSYKYDSIRKPPVDGIRHPGDYTYPENHTIKHIVSSLKAANQLYHMDIQDRADLPSKSSCILMVVQPRNVNICDERPIEYGLWDQGTPTFRVVWGKEFLDRTRCDASSSRLFYDIPNHDVEEWEVSVVYLRAGYDPAEYDETGRETRRRIETSFAIKCPTITTHLATYKRVQEYLTRPGEVEKFLPDAAAKAVRTTFMPMYPLDSSSRGLFAREMALDPDRAKNYVLKPCLEGGGHNVFGEDIPNYLADIPKQDWPKHVLMELIQPPLVKNLLISPSGIYAGSVVSELGIFGSCIWRSNTYRYMHGADQRHPTNSEQSHLDNAQQSHPSSAWLRQMSKPESRVANADRSHSNSDQSSEACGPNHVCRPSLIQNIQAGWSFKTKAAHVDEMSVVKGYGCFDSPLLDDEEVAVDPTCEGWSDD